MGVQLGDLLSKEEISFEVLSGKTIAIDAYNAIYQFLSIIRQKDGTPLLDLKGRVTSHLSGIFYRTARLIEAGIKPIYIFDGKPPALKHGVIEKRRESREEAASKWKEALERKELGEARTYAQASSKLTEEMIVESKKLLSLMGVPAIQAPSEGEAQAALLAQRGEAYACASQDYDTLLFGAPILIRNLTITGKRKLPNKDIYVDISTELIDLQRNLELLKIDRRKLIWIGILVGTDFNEGVKGIGPKKALKLVSNCNSLEEVIKESNGIFESDPREIEKIFLEPDIEKNYSIEFGIPDKHSIIDFLCGEHSFSKERFEKTLDSLISVLSEKTEQSKLESWFK